jgi:DNA primase small subunit
VIAVTVSINIQKEFQKHYASSFIPVSRFKEREFGFGTLKKIDYRHRTFQSEKEFNDFLRLETPLFASYSTGFYLYPERRPIENKEFQSAELVFDLDSPTTNCGHDNKELFCWKCFSNIKQQCVRLVEDFLEGDFGIPSSSISVNYSGSKGFHIHVAEGNWLNLNGVERRRLCEFVKGSDVDFETIFVKSAPLKGPDSQSKGWKGKFRDFAIKIINESEELKSRGATAQQSKKIIANKNEIIQSIKTGNWERVRGLEGFWKLLVPEFVEKNKVVVDDSVTFDLHRLIRIPETLHGETGFIAKRLDLNEVEDFDPFFDASLKGEGLSFKNENAVKIKGLPVEEKVDFSTALFLECKKRFGYI